MSRRSLERQGGNLEDCRRALEAVELERTTRSFGERAYEKQAQAETVAGVLGREERLAGAAPGIGRHPGAPIPHFDADHGTANSESKDDAVAGPARVERVLEER